MGDEPVEVEGWIRQQVLGSGGFGIVTLWKNKDDNKMIAVKKCRWGADSQLTQKHKERWTKEVDIMQRLNHQGVVSALPVPHELDRHLRGELPLLCMEYCTKGDLRQVLNKPENCCGLPELVVRALILDVTNAVEYLHAHKITHRDLKPENIVMQDTDAGKVIYKLIDLGYAKELDQSSMCASFVGTLQYLAPELFLGEKYSCTVDYWSLGLVAHEVITGVRPFLPGLPPAKWMMHVKNKAQDDICAYENVDGTIEFRKQLFPENHISQWLQYHMEKWLRNLLNWDPKCRGRSSDDGKSLLVFSMLVNILKKKVVPVYCVPNSQPLTYEVDEATELLTLQQWIARDTRIPIADQELLFPRGSSPSQELPASQCCAPVDAPAEWAVYVFNRRFLMLPDVKPNLPPLVSDMIKDARSPVPYALQKKTWAHALFFLQQEASLYCCFLRAHRAKMLYVLSYCCDLGKLVTQLSQENKRLLAQHDFYAVLMESEQKNTNDFNMPEVKDLAVKWMRNAQKLALRLQTLQERCESLEREAESIGIQALQLQRSPFARIRITSTLDSLVDAGKNCYESLRTRSKDQRQVPQSHVDMARVVYNCLKQRDKLLHDEPFNQHLKQLLTCLNAAEKAFGPINILMQEIASLKSDIFQSQLERQRETWELMKRLHNMQLTHVSAAMPVRSNISAANNQGAQKPAVFSHDEVPVMESSKSFLVSDRTSSNDPPKPASLSACQDFSHQAKEQDVSHKSQKSSPLMCSLPIETATEACNIIQANQDLRYMTQDLFNKSFQVYKEYIESVEDLQFE